VTLEHTLDCLARCVQYIPSNKSKGALNYILSRLVLTVLGKQGLSYQNLSDVIAALNDAAEEIRRRLLNPYEDEAIKKNGDLEEYVEHYEEWF
jgi:hypothetical protein